MICVRLRFPPGSSDVTHTPIHHVTVMAQAQRASSLGCGANPVLPLIGDRHKGHFAPLGARITKAHLPIMVLPFTHDQCPTPRVGWGSTGPDWPDRLGRVAQDMTGHDTTGGREGERLGAPGARCEREVRGTRCLGGEAGRGGGGVTMLRRALDATDEGIRTGPDPERGGIP